MKNTWIEPGYKLGILGGGQLARMLALDANPLGLQVHIYSANKEDPAGQVTAYHHAGLLSDKKALKKFLNHVDAVTFESEFVDGARLHQLSKATHTPFYPNPLLMDQLQDRLTQKQLLKYHEIPSAPFIAVDGEQDFEHAVKHFRQGFVLKKRRFGYDGYGTYFVPSRGPRPNVNWHTPHGFIAEQKITFRRELAISLFRNRQGQIRHFPLVETFQQEARCLWVRGPTEHPQLSSLLHRLKEFMNAIQMVGTMAFELFDVGQELLVNELAPRVHNSGHYSQNALEISQFEMHIRAVLGSSLPAVKFNAPGFAMWNLLGSEKKTIGLKSDEATHLHWYGKQKNQKGRKMGHVNALASSPQKALNLARRAVKNIKL
jgi:5-(carboxyamino)imidazole ribonucleotide synthase